LGYKTKIEEHPLSTKETQQKILVVDDNEMIRDLLERMLIHLGYKVAMAKNGQEAIDMLREDAAQFDIIIVDLIMPKMDGLACFDEIKSLNPDIPVIISSGIDESVNKASLFSKGVSAYLAKPSTIEKVKETLEKFRG
jgi:CheY-like chemotaxis protein